LAHVRKLGQRKDGSAIWQARIPDPARPGGTAKIERSFRTRREAEDWIASQRTAQLEGTYIHPRKGKTLFRDVAATWEESWPNRLSPTTALRYRSILNTHVLPAFGATPLAKIDRAAVQRWANRLTANGAPPATVRSAYRVLRTALGTAVRDGLLVSNPATKIALPRPASPESWFLSATEVRELAEKIDPHYRTLVYTAAYTGLRAGELLALRRQDVDLLRGSVRVRRSLKDVNGRLEFGELKTTGSRRDVTLPRFLRELLAEHLSQPTPGGSGPDALVFASKTGQPLRHNLFYRRHFKPAVLHALPDKPNLRFYDLRHTCASLSIAAGAHPKLISARLGHSTIQITLDRYGHLYPDASEALAEALDAVFDHSVLKSVPGKAVARVAVRQPK
jgi:integrase